MNYLETGLPHTQFFPKKTFFSPPRSIPMSGLSRKYMGLEPVTKKEIDTISNRLSKPKKRSIDEDPTKVTREARPMVTGTGRFVGRKRMSSFQIERMVARLYNRRTTKDFAFVDEMPDPNAVQSRLDEDSDSEMEERPPEKPKEKPPLEREHSILRKDSSGPHKEPLKSSANVSFQESDIPKLNLDTHVKRGDSKTKELHTLSRQSSVQKTKVMRKEIETKSAKHYLHEVPQTDAGRSVTMDSTNKKTQSLISEGFKPAKLETVRPATSDNSQRSPMMTRESQRPSTSENPQRSPRTVRVVAARPDEANKQKLENRVPRTAMPCDELLIDRVAIYNRSPRQRHEVKR